jgi:hypothetical protein
VVGFGPPSFRQAFMFRLNQALRVPARRIAPTLTGISPACRAARCRMRSEVREVRL